MSGIRLGAVVLAWGLAGVVAVRGDAPKELSLAEFAKIHEQLQPPRGEAWQELPWKLSLLEAQQQAAKEKKPIFMLVRSGHPLGCV